jgi:hypothetical protein
MIRLAALFGLIALPALIAATAPAPARADGCYICTRGSACGQYCRYPGRDSWAKRKKCIAAGCKIGGTASCPTAANVRICSGVGLLPGHLRQYADGNPRPGLVVPWPREPGRTADKFCTPR